MSFSCLLQYSFAYLRTYILKDILHWNKDRCNKLHFTKLFSLKPNDRGGNYIGWKKCVDQSHTEPYYSLNRNTLNSTVSAVACLVLDNFSHFILKLACHPYFWCSNVYGKKMSSEAEEVYIVQGSMNCELQGVEWIVWHSACSL